MPPTSTTAPVIKHSLPLAKNFHRTSHDATPKIVKLQLRALRVLRGAPHLDTNSVSREPNCFPIDLNSIHPTAVDDHEGHEEHEGIKE